MDEEAMAALDLSGDRLRSMRGAGLPGVVAKRRGTVIPVSAADFAKVTFSFCSLATPPITA